MIVILKQDVSGTGKAGEVVKVSDGFARNRLIPKGLAMEATEGNIRSLEKQKALQAKKAADARAGAEKTAAELKDKKVVLKCKAGGGGKLFGSITSKDVAEAAKEQLRMNLDKKQINMAGPIKMVGNFEVEIKLYQDVKGRLSVVVEG